MAGFQSLKMFKTVRPVWRTRDCVLLVADARRGGEGSFISRLSAGARELRQRAGSRLLAAGFPACPRVLVDLDS